MPGSPSRPRRPHRGATQRTQSSDSRAASAGAGDNGLPAGDGRNPDPKMRSYALLVPDTMALYMRFYKHTYGKSCLDRKTKEFVAIAASLTSGCKNCLEGHLKKALKNGATREEISEVIAITLGVSAATIVDRSDIAAANLGIDPESWTFDSGDGRSE